MAQGKLDLKVDSQVEARDNIIFFISILIFLHFAWTALSSRTILVFYNTKTFVDDSGINQLFLVLYCFCRHTHTPLFTSIFVRTFINMKTFTTTIVTNPNLYPVNLKAFEVMRTMQNVLIFLVRCVFWSFYKNSHTPCTSIYVRTFTDIMPPQLLILTLPTITNPNQTHTHMLAFNSVICLVPAVKVQ